VFVSVDWTRIPKDEKFSEQSKSAEPAYDALSLCPVFNPKANVDPGSFVETGGVVSIEAEHFAKVPVRAKRPVVSWS
jgi:hypothetical protein